MCDRLHVVLAQCVYAWPVLRDQYWHDTTDVLPSINPRKTNLSMYSHQAAYSANLRWQKLAVVAQQQQQQLQQDLR